MHVYIFRDSYSSLLLNNQKQRQQKKRPGCRPRTQIYLQLISMCAQTDPSAKRQNLINHHMLALISVSLQISLSKLPASSSIVHIPKPNSYISFSNNPPIYS